MRARAAAVARGPLSLLVCRGAKGSAMQADEYRLAVDLVEAGHLEDVSLDLDRELQYPEASVPLPLPSTSPDEDTDSLRWPIELRGLPWLQAGRQGI